MAVFHDGSDRAGELDLVVVQDLGRRRTRQRQEGDQGGKADMGQSKVFHDCLS